MKSRRPSRHGEAMLPARRSTGVTSRGRPRRRLPTTLKCHCRGRCRRMRATRLWARAPLKQLTLPERTSRRSGLVWRPVGRAPLSRRDPHPTKLTPREDRRSSQRPPASFTMAPTAPTLTPCRGVDRGGSSRSRRRCRACRRRRSQAPPRGTCSHCLYGAAKPRTSISPSSPAGAKDQLQLPLGPEGQPLSEQGNE
jgi:hypothetical protein